MIDNRTKLISGRALSPLDPQICEAVNSLPPPAPSRYVDRQRAGILNEQGDVYREVDAFTLLDLLHLTARLNALGYRVAPEQRERQSRRYSVIFAPRQIKVGGGGSVGE